MIEGARASLLPETANFAKLVAFAMDIGPSLSVTFTAPQSMRGSITTRSLATHRGGTGSFSLTGSYWRSHLPHGESGLDPDATNPLTSHVFLDVQRKTLDCI
jgi:hypothetical protein